LIVDHWLPVPFDAILSIKSPDGHVHACWPASGERIRCVILPPEAGLLRRGELTSWRESSFRFGFPKWGRCLHPFLQPCYPVHVLSRFHTLQTNDPDIIEIQWREQLPRHLVWQPWPAARVQKHNKCFAFGVCRTALCLLLPNGSQNLRLEILRIPRRSSRHQDVLCIPCVVRDSVDNDSITTPRIARECEFVGLTIKVDSYA